MISDEDILRIETRVLERGEGATPKNTAWLCNTIRNMKVRLAEMEKSEEKAQGLLDFSRRFRRLGEGWNLDNEKGSWVIYNDVGISFAGDTIVSVLLLAEHYVTAKRSLEQERSRPPVEKQKRVKLNLNNYIYFKLTPRGITIINGYYSRFKQSMGPEQNGEYKLQIYTFMEIFGSYMYMGMPDRENPFATMNVEIQKS